MTRTITQASDTALFPSTQTSHGQTAHQTVQWTTSAIETAFQKQKQFQLSVRQSSAKERVSKLKALKRKILENSSALQDALQKDFRKSSSEVDLTEIFPTLSEINFAIKNLSTWMKPIRVGTPLALLGTKSEILYEPKGIVLIIGPWNYPFHLLIAPLISSIAAGNCSFIKPSELAPHTGRFVTRLLSELFDPQEVICMEGDASLSKNLLTLPFDHIFFTGSTRVGKVVMEAASKNLSSVTLELGGKSPAIVDESADLTSTAERITWGKFVNGGQTCVAPDYVLVHEARYSQFMSAIKKAISRSYGETEKDREKSQDLCRIINTSNYHRLKKLTEETVKSGAQVELGGVFNDAERYISPTLLTQVSLNSPIMSEEIFGPILPVLTYRSLDEIYPTIQRTGKPLALYIFSSQRKQIKEILKNTSAGGTCINNTLIHLMNPSVPFGGVGTSGLGSYHGFFGFKAFSHERTITRQWTFSPLRLVYPPYLPWVQKLIQLVVKFMP